MQLDGKLVAITGSGRGIGRAMALAFAQKRANLALIDLNAEALAQTQTLCEAEGIRAVTYLCNVTREQEVESTLDKVVADFGRFDVMINNAGIIGAVGPIKDTPLEGWNRTLAILLTGVFLGTKHAARVMVPQRSGVIVSVASTAGVMGGLGPHAYTAAKHGVVGLTKSAASELAQHGVRVNAVAPGGTATAMTASLLTNDAANLALTGERIAAGSPLGIAAEAQDPAYAMLYLASDEARNVTGHTLLVDAGQTTGGTVPAFHNGEVGLIGAPAVG